MTPMLRTDYFLALVAFNRIDGVKQRIRYNNLADIRVPGVPIDMQAQFAERRHKAMARISNAKTALIKGRTNLRKDRWHSEGSPKVGLVKQRPGGKVIAHHLVRADLSKSCRKRHRTQKESSQTHRVLQRRTVP